MQRRDTLRARAVGGGGRRAPCSKTPPRTEAVMDEKIYRVIDNIEEINNLPAAELMKTSDRMSLAEVRMRLEDIVRFRLEPLSDQDVRVITTPTLGPKGGLRFVVRIKDRPAKGRARK